MTSLNFRTIRLGYPRLTLDTGSRVVLLALASAIYFLIPSVAQPENAGRINSLAFELVARGDFPIGLMSRQGAMKVADVYGNGQDVLVVDITSGPMEPGIRALALLDQKWTRAFPAGGLEIHWELSDLAHAWTVGDTDDDGNDEILVFVRDSLYKHEWDGTRFRREVFPLPGTGRIEQAIVGDVDNRQGNELIVFGLRDTADWLPPENVPGCLLGPPYILGVWKATKDRYKLIWQDRKEMRYYTHDIMPADKFVAIADVENTGKNQLVIEHSQSDVRPTRFDFLLWRDGGFGVNKSVVISGGKLWNYEEYWARGDIGNSVVGAFLPMRQHSETCLYSFGYWDSSLRNALIFVSNNQFAILDISPEELLLPYSHYRDHDQLFTVWMDPDGKGKGLMRIAYLKKYYLFYRQM